MLHGIVAAMGKTRTRWAVDEKRRIVELTLEPGASVARVAQAESERLPDTARLDLPITADADPGHLAAKMLQPRTCAKYGTVFNRRNDDVVAGTHHSLQGQIVAFSAAACEDNLRWQTIEERSNLLAGMLHMCKCAPAATVDRRWVTKRL